MGNNSLPGREREREDIERLLRQGSGAIVLQGDPGMGKTAMLDHARTHAGGFSVLSCRGCPDESELPHAALSDLLG